jgi:hypothetical protein
MSVCSEALGLAECCKGMCAPRSVYLQCVYLCAPRVVYLRVHVCVCTRRLVEQVDWGDTTRLAPAPALGEAPTMATKVSGLHEEDAA